MSEPRLPGDLSHLERLLSAWASREENIPAGRARRLVGFVAVTAMIDGLRDQDGQPRLVLKGGASLQLRIGPKARATRDFDTAYNGDLDEARDLIDQALHVGWNHFAGRLSDEQEIVGAGVVPPPRRYRIRLTYRGKPFDTVAFEMSAAEGGSLDAPEIAPAAVSLAPVQLPDLDAVAFLPARYQVAQKLHACTEPPIPEHPNDRARDLYDIILIDDALAVTADPEALRQAGEEIFALRTRHPWPPTIVVQPSWPALWATIQQDEQTDLTLDDAVAKVTQLIGRAS
jgi:hypothetical protein